MNEDFVSFDLAVKLKEKGFDWKCMRYYDTKDIEKDYFHWCANESALARAFYHSWNTDNKGFRYERIDAPTISQVLKWLREEKKIYLEIVIVVNAEYMCDIYKISPRPIECLGSTEYFKTYEQAALAGVNYCLENLI